jgi:hypothetical protein
MPTNKNSSSALQCQTSEEKLIPEWSIPQERGHIPYSFDEFPKRDPIPIDSTPLLKVKDFRLYLMAQKAFLDLGIIV